MAIVTGAGRGIGRAVAEKLAASGAAVGLIARSGAELDDARSACESFGAKAAAAVADVADRAALGRALETLENELGAPPDLLVSNAGMEGPEAALWESGFDAWWRTIEVNLGGALAAAAIVLPGMVARGRGRLVHLNSLQAARDVAPYGAYAVSKAALLRLGGVLAASLAGTGVMVFDVSPGLVRTSMTDAMGYWADVPDEDWTPVDRVASFMTEIARGRFDAMTGRFLHALDDWDDLERRAGEIAAGGGRALRLTPGWPGDPILE